jgi:hypothetical protein
MRPFRVVREVANTGLASANQESKERLLSPAHNPLKVLHLCEHTRHRITSFQLLTMATLCGGFTDPSRARNLQNRKVPNNDAT